MFDELFPEQADQGLERVAVNANAPKPERRPTTWDKVSQFAKAPFKGVAAGAAEGTASTADILGAFGQVMAATDARPGGMFSVPQRSLSDVIVGGNEQDQAAKKLMRSGIDYNSEAGRSFRNVAADYTPDPHTTNVAESIVFNLFRVGSKALTSAATIGNIPGAVVAGLEEGFTQSDQLGQQGVDLETRTKVGTVTAATNAVGFALPAAGKTWLQTGALALAGGPASFIAQNAATREILASADYSKLSDQYDPFDPVGLALSTVLPLGFGALAMRGAKAGGKGPKAEIPPTPKPDHEAVDAALTLHAAQNIDSHMLAKSDSLAAREAHSRAYVDAARALDEGAALRASDIQVDIAHADRVVADVKARLDAANLETAQVQGQISPTVARAAKVNPDDLAYPLPESAFQPTEVVGRQEPVFDSTSTPTTGGGIDTTLARDVTGQNTAQTPIARAEKAVAQRPNMLVRMDDGDSPTTASDLLQSVKEEVHQDTQDGKAYAAAVECFLRAGT